MWLIYQKNINVYFIHFCDKNSDFFVIFILKISPLMPPPLRKVIHPEGIYYKNMVSKCSQLRLGKRLDKGHESLFNTKKRYSIPLPPQTSLINVEGPGKASDNMIQINIAQRERGVIFLLKNQTTCTHFSSRIVDRCVSNMQ